MVDPRMAQATAVHTKIAMIAAIRLSMMGCVSTLSAASPTYPLQLTLSSTFWCKVQLCAKRLRAFSARRSCPCRGTIQLVPTGSGSHPLFAFPFSPTHGCHSERAGLFFLSLPLLQKGRPADVRPRGQIWAILPLDPDVR